MTYENDKLIIPDKYRKMSVYELRSEKEKISADYKKSPSYGVKKLVVIGVSHCLSFDFK